VSSRTPPRSLRRKLLMIVMAATGAAMATSMAALLAHETWQYRQSGLRDLQAQAELLSKSLAPTLLFNDRKAARDTLATLTARPDILEAVVMAADGGTFATHRAHDAPDSGEATTGWLPLLTELSLTYRISESGETLGQLQLTRRLDLAQRLQGLVAILIAAAVPGLALAALIFRRLHPKVTGPVLAVAEAARQVKDERRYDIRVTATSDDEIGQLIDAFNRMVRDLALEMSERRGAEEALRLADRRKDEFLATLAHELRNPLAPIATAVELLQRAGDDEARRTRSIDIIRRQLKQLVRLVDDLLEVSRITRGKLELRREPVELTALARTACEAAQPVVEQRRHSLDIDLPAEGVWVQGDAARLLQVIVNLLTNAAKYTPPQGRLRLSVKATGDGAVDLAVEDNGVGIAPEHREQVFDMFFQVDHSLGRGSAGLGVGLTIASQLVAMHDGRLSLHSDGLGQGSRFTVHLPTVAPPAAAAPAALAAPDVRDESGPRPGGAKVLIADDNTDFADSLGALLRADRHQVRVVHNGLDAWGALQRDWADVAFLDVGMPGLDGLQLARRIRAGAPSRPITLVAVTGWGQASDHQRVMEAGFDQHWVKPFEPERALRLAADLRGPAAPPA
jgi:two-component system, sensor histidine kinase